MTTERPKFELVPVDCNELEELTKVFSAANINALPDIQKAIAVAHGTALLRERLRDKTFTRLIKSLAGSPIGFFKDKEYGDEVYQECATQAMITGHRLTGSEWGIIAGRVYSAKAFFERALSEIPGLTTYPVEHSAVEFASDKSVAVVTSAITFEIGGKKDTISKRFTVKAGQYASVEQIEGKAERKILKTLYKHITGNNLLDGDADDLREPINVTPLKPQSEQGKVSSLNDEINAQN